MVTNQIPHFRIQYVPLSSSIILFIGLEEINVNSLPFDLMAAIFDTAGSEPRIATLCGDSRVVWPEMCDDGNNNNGDGCSADCLVIEASNF